MEGFAVVDGGRRLKAGLLAFGAFLWAAPVVAQTQDPLAPLPVGRTATNTPNGSQAPNPATATQSGPAVPGPTQVTAQTTAQPPVQAPPLQIAVAAPKDWRGVFDAIDAG